MRFNVLRTELEMAMHREMDNAVRVAVDRVVELVEAMELQNAARTVVESGGSTRTHFERVMEVMQAADDAPLSSSEIATAAGIEPGSARMILYTNKDRFTARRVSPGRVRWTLADQYPVVRQESVCAM